MIEHGRPDIIVIEKDNKMALLIDIAVPWDTRVEKKKQEKIDKYQDLAWELKSLWNVEITVILIVAGALGEVPKGLKKKFRKAETTVSVELLQKAALLGTAWILSKVIGTG